jgi:hypothetical protein
MTDLTAVAGWDNVVQLETITFALGGVGGPMNAQAQALLNRTEYLNTQLGLRAPLASPTFSGAPLAPTAAPGTATTQLATTNFVDTSFAKKSSPTFTGIPLAPTAAPGTVTTQIATCEFVSAAVALVTGDGLAPLASPAFTGAPTAPTQLTSDNSTRLATTAYVKANMTDLAPLASPALTGTPTAPTAAATTDTTQLATTAFARSLIGLRKGWVEYNSNISMPAADVGKAIKLVNGGVGQTYTVTVPNANAVTVGACIYFTRATFASFDDAITIASVVSGVTNRIIGLAFNGNVTLRYGHTLTLCSDGTDWVIIEGSVLDTLQDRDIAGNDGYQTFSNGMVHVWGRVDGVGAGLTVTLPYALISTLVSYGASPETANVTTSIKPDPANPLTKIILTSHGNAGNARADVFVKYNVWGYR